MSEAEFAWQRLWVRRDTTEGSSSLDFVQRTHPTAPSSPALIPLEELLLVPCLGLLGNLGSGKTHTVQSAFDAQAPELSAQGAVVRWHDLRAFDSGLMLRQALFEDEPFVAWRQGTHRLYLFLDSLDECRLRIDTVAALLLECLRDYPRERLFLRIVCRPTAWSSLLENGLRQLWGPDAVEVYELTPLGRDDIAVSAEQAGLEPDRFLRALAQRNVLALAQTPINLKFLLREYQRAGQLPGTQADLYARGCFRLCEEQSRSRQASRQTGHLTADERLVIARRIAALTLLANRYGVWIGGDPLDDPYVEADLTLRDLAGGKEPVGDELLSVNQYGILETLDTGLFTGQGIERLGWAHQSYAEFLTAQYLVMHQLTQLQVASLLLHPGDSEERVIPQLQGVAVWAAILSRDIFQLIVEHDPEVLLRSDFTADPSVDRARLVDALLAWYAHGAVLDWRSRNAPFYAELAHPRLVDQLRPYLTEYSSNATVHQVAVDIARACQLHALQTDLVALALDSRWPEQLRISAVAALLDLGDSTAKAHLRALVTDQADSIRVDELKGAALLALWPDHLTAAELFGVLTPPQQENLVDLYKFFLRQDPMRHLQPADLPHALTWVAQQIAAGQIGPSLIGVAEAILLLAWEYLAAPQVFTQFITIMADVLRADDLAAFLALRQPYSFEAARPLLGEQIRQDAERRHSVLAALVPALLDADEDPDRLRGTPFLLGQDAYWLLDQLQRTDRLDVQQVFARFIRFLHDPTDLARVEPVFEMSRTNPVLAQEVDELFQAIPLDSPQAAAWRRLHRPGTPRQVVDQPPPPPLTQQIETLLGACEAGAAERWWEINHNLMRDSVRGRYHSHRELEPDVRNFPGWAILDRPTQERIIATALPYLLAQDPQTDRWLGTTTVYLPTFAGFRAFYLLHEEVPERLAELPPSIWERWAPAILAYPTTTGTEAARVQRLLVKRAYSQAPAAILRSLPVLMDRDNRETGNLFITRRIEECWDKRLAQLLLEKARDPALTPAVLGTLLGELLQHDVAGAHDLALSFLPTPSVGDASEERAVLAARALLLFASDAGWQAIWPLIQHDTGFGRALLERFIPAASMSRSPLTDRLPEDAIADLYLWLVQQYPPVDDTEPDETTFLVGVRTEIGWWRDRLPDALAARGTPQGVAAIRRIMVVHPEQEWLRYVLARARSETRQRTWIPPSPATVLRLARDRQSRLVENAEQLQEVVLESIQRLAQKLQGQTALVRSAWNIETRNRKTRYWPKDENDFSDQVAHHLREDIKAKGVIINREAQIRRGEETDIRVDAVVAVGEDIGESVTIIVEVKGCWHDELYSAMETQLVNTYLRESGCQHGIYLVGWFLCPQWDDADRRKKRTQQQAPDIDQLRQRLQEQAARLSQDDLRVRAVVTNAALR